MNLTGGVSGDGDGFFTGLVVLFLAAASRIVFWRSGLNYAEHLILNIYLFAQIALLLAMVQLVSPFVPESARAALLILAIGASSTYVVWGYSRVFTRRPFLAAAGGLVSLALGIPLWLLTLAMVLNFIRGF
jgi:hypothetical protein